MQDQVILRDSPPLSQSELESRRVELQPGIEVDYERPRIEPTSATLLRRITTQKRLENAYSVEIVRESSLTCGQPRSFWIGRVVLSALSRVTGSFAVARTLGPALGGVLSKPTKHFPFLFPSEGFFDR